MLNLVSEVQAKRGRAPAEPSDRSLPIYERILARTQKALAKSIVEAQGRFHGADEGAEEKARASACWKVATTVKGSAPGENEQVYIGVPCGNKFMPWLQDIEGNVVGQAIVDSDKVVANLEAFQAQMQGLQKDSKMGKDFHNHAIKNTEPPVQKEASEAGWTLNTDKAGGEGKKPHYYCSKADDWLDTDHQVIVKKHKRKDAVEEMLKNPELKEARKKTLAAEFAKLEGELG